MTRALIFAGALVLVLSTVGCGLNLGSLGGLLTSLAGATSVDLKSTAPAGTASHTVTASGSGLRYDVQISPTTASQAGALTLDTRGKARSMVVSDGSSISVQISDGTEDVGNFRPFGSAGPTVDIREGTVTLQYTVDRTAGTSRLDHVAASLAGKTAAGAPPVTYDATWTR